METRLFIKPKVSAIVSMLGARRGYAVPQIFESLGYLNKFFTDIVGVKGVSRLFKLIPFRIAPSQVKKIIGRNPGNIPLEKIKTFDLLGIRLYFKLRMAKSQPSICKALMVESSRFCNKIVGHGIKNANVVYTFNGAGLELLQAAKKDGLLCISEQTIAPMRIERELLKKEKKKYPGWDESSDDDEVINEFMIREELEWEYSDFIVCGSEFVKNGVVACGGDENKCVVIPYGLDINHNNGRRKIKDKKRKIRVLTVGVVGLRKGTPYVIEAARSLMDIAEFRVVGDCGVISKLQFDCPSNIKFTGAVPRMLVEQEFEWADVFLLPSICEGSAMVIFEAMAFGLPIICTDNTGSVITNGKEGIIVNSSNSDEIIDAIKLLSENEEFYSSCSEHSLQTSNLYTFDMYKNRVAHWLNSLKID